MRVLVVAEHDNQALRAASLSCLTFAQAVAEATGGCVTCLVLGDKVELVAAQTSQFARVIAVQSPLLAHPLADSFARAITTIVRERQFELVSAAATTFSKDVLPRAAALLGGAMASDVVRHELTEAGLQVDCSPFAGAGTATLRLIASPQVVTVRGSAYPAAKTGELKSYPLEHMEIEIAKLASRCQYIGLKSKDSARPDVTEARIVVSGGRALKNSDDFERLVGH